MQCRLLLLRAYALSHIYTVYKMVHSRLGWCRVGTYELHMCDIFTPSLLACLFFCSFCFFVFRCFGETGRK